MLVRFLASLLENSFAIAIPLIEHALDPIIEIEYVFNKSKFPMAYNFLGGLVNFFKFSGYFSELIFTISTIYPSFSSPNIFYLNFYIKLLLLHAESKY